MQAEQPLDILLVEDNPGDAGLVKEWLAELGGCFRIRHAERLTEALKNLTAGTPDLVLLDLMLPDSAGLETVLAVRRQAPETGVVVFSGVQDETLALNAVRAGAQDFLVKGRTPPEMLARSMRYAVERQRRMGRFRRVAGDTPRRAAKVIAFLGAKGGVGTTTVAASVAAAMARKAAVIAAELDGRGAGLAEYFRIQACGGSIWEVEQPDEAEVSRRLWRLPSGLRVLLGAQTVAGDEQTWARKLETVLEAVARMADRVILDLPWRAWNVVRAAVRHADLVVLVVEREPAAVAAGRRMVEQLRKDCLVEGLVRAVIVNRVALAAPMPLSEIEQQLAAPIAAVVPPNADLCVQARRTGAPVVFFQPESPVAVSLVELAGKLEEATAAGIINL